MAMRIRSSLVFRALVFALILAIPVLAVARLHDQPPPIAILLNGDQVMVPPTMTFGGLVRSHHLKARDGRLLDVDGKTLDPHADPGSVTLDGESASRKRLLHAGDQIVVENGKDTTEPTVHRRTTLPGQQAGDPQYTLRTSRVEQITTMGKISGTIVSVRYHSEGKGSTPPAVALTFDDGPWPGSTRKILHILKRMNAKATFFLIGEQVAKYPKLVRAEQKAGMEIGNHTWSHPEPPSNPSFDKLSPARMRNEMTRTNDALAKVGISEPKAFRSSGGFVNDAVVSTAAKLGMRVVVWNVDPKDWESSTTKKELVANVLHQVRPGSIVDLHDGGGDQSATVAALPDIIKGIRKKGLDLVVL